MTWRVHTAYAACPGHLETCCKGPHIDLPQRMPSLRHAYELRTHRPSKDAHTPPQAYSVCVLCPYGLTSHPVQYPMGPVHYRMDVQMVDLDKVGAFLVLS